MRRQERVSGKRLLWRETQTFAIIANYMDMKFLLAEKFKKEYQLEQEARG